MKAVRTLDKAGAAVHPSSPPDETTHRVRGSTPPHLRISRGPHLDRLAAPVGTDADVAGAQRLALAVLEDGIRAALGLKGDAMSAAWRRWELLWLMSDDRTEPFAFARICDLVGIDAEHLRGRVLEACLPEVTRHKSGRVDGC
jgi:hypothetical protein